MRTSPLAGGAERDGIGGAAQPSNNGKDVGSESVARGHGSNGKDGSNSGGSRSHEPGSSTGGEGVGGGLSHGVGIGGGSDGTQNGEQDLAALAASRGVGASCNVPAMYRHFTYAACKSPAMLLSPGVVAVGQHVDEGASSRLYVVAAPALVKATEASALPVGEHVILS